MKGILTVNRLAKYALLNDAEIIKLYREGETIALNELVHRYHSNMFRYITSLEGSDAAEDVLQNTWEIVTVALQNGSYKEEQHFGQFIKGVAYRQAMKMWHDMNRLQAVGEPLPDIADDAMNSEDGMMEHDREAMLAHALKHIGRREARVFILHAIRGKSFRAVAVMMHISNTGSVRNMYRAAVEKLSRLLAEGSGAL